MKKMNFHRKVMKKVVSEFGQSLNAKAGFLASRVEYTKPFEDHSGLTATLHFGADTCVRSAGCRNCEIVSSSEATTKKIEEDTPTSALYIDNRKGRRQERQGFIVRTISNTVADGADGTERRGEVRQAYTKDHARRVQAFDAAGQPKQGKDTLTHLAGPLCFQGPTAG